MSGTHKSHGHDRSYKGRNAYQHWYRDNQVYFITTKCHSGLRALAGDEPKQIFWDRFRKYTVENEFYPWVTSVMDNHYHTLGYLRHAGGLAKMMQGIHGATAKLINDLREHPLKPFWGEYEGKTYFDGCIRDEKQCRHAFRYVLTQAERHGICRDYRDYPHTIVDIDLERGLRRATELNAFLRGVRYKRYEDGRRRGD